MSKPGQGEIHVCFWRCNQLRKIRIGHYDEYGVFHQIDSVPIRGAEYSDDEVFKATRLVQKAKNARRAA